MGKFGKGKALVLLAACMSFAFSPASAGPVKNRVAVFAALDKITGDITTLEVPLDEVAKFGTFRIRPRTCHTRPPTEKPKTMAFVEIDEFTYDKKRRRVFTGWMNAESPGLHAVEHPLFDVWLTGCKEPLGEVQSTSTPATGGATPAKIIAPAAPTQDDGMAGSGGDNTAATVSLPAGSATPEAIDAEEKPKDRDAPAEKAAARGGLFIGAEPPASPAEEGREAPKKADRAANLPDSTMPADIDAQVPGRKAARAEPGSANGENADAVVRRDLYDLDLSRPEPPKAAPEPVKPPRPARPRPPTRAAPALEPEEELGPLY